MRHLSYQLPHTPTGNCRRATDCVAYINVDVCATRDGDRFDFAVRQVVGKRLTYAELTGKENPQA